MTEIDGTGGQTTTTQTEEKVVCHRGHVLNKTIMTREVLNRLRDKGYTSSPWCQNCHTALGSTFYECSYDGYCPNARYCLSCYEERIGKGRSCSSYGCLCCSCGWFFKWLGIGLMSSSICCFAATTIFMPMASFAAVDM